MKKFFVKILLATVAVAGAEGILAIDKAFAAEVKTAHHAVSTKAPEAFHASGVSYNDKRLALMFLSEELMHLGTNGGPATDEYLGLQENIMADEESPRTVHHLAMSYKSRHPEEDSFAAAFAPTERLVFEKDGVWHALDLAGTTPVGERCYTQSGAATRCP